MNPPPAPRSHPLILLGGCGLAFGAAFANLAVVLQTGASVCHLTGDISRLSMDLVRSGPGLGPEAPQVAAAALAFFLGAVTAGMVLHHPRLDFSRPYGRTISGIGLLFVVASILIARHPVMAIGLAAFACGLQNALATRYRTVVLRTTHVTGLITDLGMGLGMKLRGLPVPAFTLSVPFWLIGSFFLGGYLSAVMILGGVGDTLRLAGLAYLVAGAAWSLVKHVIAPAAVRRLSDETRGHPLAGNGDAP